MPITPMKVSPEALTTMIRGAWENNDYCAIADTLPAITLTDVLDIVAGEAEIINGIEPGTFAVKHR